jgi:hypothetical protein
MAGTMLRDEILRRFPNASKSTIARNTQAHSVAPGAEPQPDRDDEPMAADEGEVAYQGRCLIRITSLRMRLCDERNLYDKHFVDALKEAGCFVDDSPDYVKVEVRQEQVKNKADECTRIEVSPC